MQGFIYSCVLPLAWCIGLGKLLNLAKTLLFPLQSGVNSGHPSPLALRSWDEKCCRDSRYEWYPFHSFSLACGLLTPRRSNDVFLLEKSTLDYFHCNQKWRVSEFSWASSLFSPVLQTQGVKKVTEVLIRNHYVGCLLFLSGSYFKGICIDVHKIRTFINILKHLFHEQLQAATVAPADFIAKSTPKNLPWAEPPAQKL